MDALALAKEFDALPQLGSADRYDFSSRVRTPDIGKIVVWRKANGLYAATRVVGLKDDSRNHEKDELIFDYVILIQGGSNFSQVETASSTTAPPEHGIGLTGASTAKQTAQTG